MGEYDDREQVVHDRTVALFTSVDPGIAVGDGSWTARDTLAHLVTVVRRYTTLPRLARTPREVDEINADELAGLADLDVDGLLRAYAEGFTGYRALWTTMPAEQRFPFHGGGQLPTWALRANWLAEMLVHGYDVAAAAGTPWEIGAADAAALLAFLREVLPAYGRPGPAAAVEVAADGCEPWSLVADGTGVRTDGSGEASTAVSGPGGLVVLLVYRRLTVAEAVVQGLLVAGDPGEVERVLESVERP